MRHLATLSAFLALGYWAGYLLQPAAAVQDQSFARVFYCENEAGRAEVYLAGSAMTSTGKPELTIGDPTADGYLAFDFTPVAKNKTLNAVRIKLDSTGSALVVALTESGHKRDDPARRRPREFPPAPCRGNAVQGVQ